MSQLEFKAEDQGGARRLAVLGEITIYTAAEFRGRLLAELKSVPRRLDLDLTDAREFDSAAVQVLLFAQREATREQRELQVCSASPAVTDLMTLYGLTASLPAAELKAPTERVEP